MAENTRQPENQTSKLDKGVYMARIVGHLDPSFMGGLEVTLLRTTGNAINDNTQSYVVKYATPFYGVTSYDNQGQNSSSKAGSQSGFDDTQKSYGMTFVPPDVGATVLCMFVEGNPAEGYWFACVPDRFANHMIPAIAASENVDISKDDKTKYNYTSKSQLPVAEINRLANDNTTGNNIDKIKKPVHPIADVFLEQGLIEDDTRGITTSTMRRNAPSMVFGISTPGPYDRREGAKRVSVGKKQTKSTNTVPASRMGGTQFVMDDGDDQYQRKKPANAGSPEYADLLKKEKGTPNIPYGEHFRIRTRTGHQILLHNSEDLIYIGNAKGTTWIELTSNGKIDIYAQDSVSIHTENDLNILADRDINLEAKRNVNIKAGGSFHAESGGDTELVVGANGFITTGSNINLNAGASNNLTSGAATNVKAGGNVVLTGAQVHMNGPAAAEAGKASALSTHANPKTSKTTGWKSKYQNGTVSSIMRRVPMHEPWILHENLAPDKLTPKNTDRDA